MIKLEGFGGMIPARDARLLPPNAAAYSENALLRDGTLRGFRPEIEIRELDNPDAKYVFRIPSNYSAPYDTSFAASKWLEFEDENTNVLRSPVVDDIYGRYYWASPSHRPMYNSTSRIMNDSPAYRLGVPGPLLAPTLVISGGSSEVIVSRAYVYTYVSGFGEEGPPSAPKLETGKQDDTWQVTISLPTSNQNEERNITHIRLYRTITSEAGVATYFQVAEFTTAQTIFNDTLSDEVVSGNPQIESIAWTPPPTDLQGLVSLPNGIFAGWVGSDVYFCEPYRPHAWPVQYALSVQAPVIGMGVVGQTLVVATAGRPVLISGVHPSQFTQLTPEVLEPCLSRSSILSAVDGVMYASQNGLVAVTSGGVVNISRELIHKDKWLSEVDPYLLHAVRHGTAYLAQQAPRETGRGIIVDRGAVGFGWMTDLTEVQNIISDVWTGEIFTIHDGKVFHFDPPTGSQGIIPYIWRSKVFDLKRPANLGAVKIQFSVPEGTPELSSIPNISLEQTLANDQYGLFRVYADGRHVFTREIRRSGDTFALPSGFKATEWQFEVEARIVIDSIEIAPSARELSKI